MASIGLFDVIKDGSLQTTRMLLEGNQDAIDARDRCGQTPLHVACAYGQLHIAQFLVQEKNANVNVVDEDGWVPLYTTCRYAGQAENRAKIAKLLLANGANVNAKVLGSNRTALHQVCRNDSNIQLVHVLLNHGAEINVQDCIGRTPLYSACNRPPHVNVIKLLLANNADRDIKDSNGMRPRDKIQGSGHECVFESYDKLPLAVPGVDKQDSGHARDSHEIVGMNPDLSQHQRALGLKALLLVRQLPVHEVAYEIVGFLTPAAVEKIFLPTV